MKMVSALRLLGLGAAMTVLVSCGGVGDLAGGVGSGGSGVAEGTVTGFGSVYIDGERYDDRAAAVTEDGPSGTRTAILKLGQRVRLQSTGNNVAESIQVLTELIGPIERIDNDGAALLLTVLGQSVRVERAVAGVSGAVTWVDFGDAPCAPDCNFAINQWVQAHGSWVMGPDAGYFLLASRIEVVEPQTKVLLSGVVREVSGGVVRMNAVSGTRVEIDNVAQAPAVSVDQVLRVWAPPPVGAQPVRAERAVPAPLTEGASASRAVLGGEVSRVSNDGAEIEIQGTRIAVPAELRGKVTAQQFARIEMERGPAGGWVLKAPPKVPTSIERAEVQLRETITVLQLRQAALGNWRLRDTLLRRTALSGECAAFLDQPIATRVRVSVQATRGPLPMSVRDINCTGE